MHRREILVFLAGQQYVLVSLSKSITLLTVQITSGRGHGEIR